MTLRVARIYRWLAVLATPVCFALSLRLFAGYLVGVVVSLLLLALIGPAIWGMRRESAWGLVLWTLTMVLVAAPLLLAGIPHSGSITTDEAGQVVTTHFEQPGSRGWLSAGLAHVLLAGIGVVELAVRVRRRRRRRDRRLTSPLLPPAPAGGPEAWVWAATAIAAGLLGWINWASDGPVVPLGLLTGASVAWGAVWSARWWGGGLLLGVGVLAGEVLRYLALGLTGWAGRQGWATLAVLAPALLGVYAGVALRAAVDRKYSRPAGVSPISSVGA